MTRAIKTILRGKRTRRGIGITRTVSCQMRAAWNPTLGGGPITREIPNPFPLSIPGRLLAQRHGIYIKYFAAGDPGGEFNLIERQTAAAVATGRGYPITKSGPETIKQIFLPITGLLRVYSGAAGVEFGSTLEYG